MRKFQKPATLKQLFIFTIIFVVGILLLMLSFVPTSPHTSNFWGPIDSSPEYKATVLDSDFAPDFRERMKIARIERLSKREIHK